MRKKFINKIKNMLDRAQNDIAQHPITPKQFARSELFEPRKEIEEKLIAFAIVLHLILKTPLDQFAI
jgi:hypothetical protein